jgi:hypothetical protein
MKPDKAMKEKSKLNKENEASEKTDTAKTNKKIESTRLRKEKARADTDFHHEHPFIDNWESNI